MILKKNHHSAQTMLSKDSKSIVVACVKFFYFTFAKNSTKPCTATYFQKVLNELLFSHESHSAYVRNFYLSSCPLWTPLCVLIRWTQKNCLLSCPHTDPFFPIQISFQNSISIFNFWVRFPFFKKIENFSIVQCPFLKRIKIQFSFADFFVIIFVRPCKRR